MTTKVYKTMLIWLLYMKYNLSYFWNFLKQNQNKRVLFYFAQEKTRKSNEKGILASVVLTLIAGVAGVIHFTLITVIPQAKKNSKLIHNQQTYLNFTTHDF